VTVVVQWVTMMVENHQANVVVSSAFHCDVTPKGVALRWVSGFLLVKAASQACCYFDSSGLVVPGSRFLHHHDMDYSVHHVKGSMACSSLPEKTGAVGGAKLEAVQRQVPLVMAVACHEAEEALVVLADLVGIVLAWEP